MNNIKKLTTKEKEEFLLSKGWEFWQLEHELINHRLTWLGIVAPLLFAGYFWVLKSNLGIENYIAVFGIITCGSIAVSCSAAIQAQRIMKNEGIVPQLGLSRCTTYMGWLPAYMVPWSVVIAWMLLIGASYCGKFEDFKKVTLKEQIVDKASQ